MDHTPIKAQLEQTRTALSIREHSDPLIKCPTSVLALLPDYPDPVLELAHSKLYTYPFASVPTCWRRLYTDASIAKAMALVEEGLRLLTGANDTYHGTKRKRSRSDEAISEDENAEDEWLDRVVRILDMASIMAGAAGRHELIDELLQGLQEWWNEILPPRTKKQRLGGQRDAFPVTQHLAMSAVPMIHYPVQSSVAPSMQSFEAYMKSAQPRRITEALRHWPAMHERPWSSPAYLLEQTFGGRRLIPVEIGRSYTDADWGQSIITFKEFMGKYMMSEITDPAKLGYLAQHDLFAQIPALRNDIAVPDYCYTTPPFTKFPSSVTGGKSPPPPRLEEPLLNAWFGPAGTVSPLHTDPYHNILCQVVGKKYIRLYSPDQKDNLYPRGIEQGGVDMRNTSTVDAEATMESLDADHPLFRHATYVETVLNEGECLYIPAGWWHYVRSLSVSFSVSFWWN
ncbi:MAG: hypothetical protein Q9174_004242 [Haloplaca sp. 1 TL-2023]